MEPNEAITRLQAARQQVAATQAANPDQFQEKQALLKKIDDRIAICQKDQDLRKEFADNKAAIEQSLNAQLKEIRIIEKVDELKSALAAKYSKRPLKVTDLSPEDRRLYMRAIEAGKQAQADLDQMKEQSDKLAKRQQEIQDEYKALRKSVAVGNKLPATPTDSVCVTCTESLASDFAPKQRRQNGGDSVYPGAQSYGNCGIQSSAQLIEAKTGKKQDEKKLLNETVKDGNAQDVLLGRLRRAVFDEKNPSAGSTTPQDRQAILKKAGIDSKIVKTSKAELAKAIRANKGIVANVDAGELWNDPQYAGGGHAIMVYDGDFDENGNLTHVYINDTGNGTQGRKMEIDEFMQAADAKKGGSSLNVTNDPVW